MKELENKLLVSVQQNEVLQRQNEQLKEQNDEDEQGTSTERREQRRSPSLSPREHRPDFDPMSSVLNLTFPVVLDGWVRRRGPSPQEHRLMVRR